MTDTTQGRILQKAKELFFQFNYSKVSVDEIAGGLGMSKKTIYKFFPSKEALLQQVLEFAFRQIEAEVRSIVEDRESDFTCKLNDILFFMARRTRLLQMPLVGEIKTRFPDLWQSIQQFRRNKVSHYMQQILQEGIEQSYFAKDTDIPLLIHIYSSLAVASIDPEFLASQGKTADAVFHDIIRMLFAGVLTEEGRHHILQHETQRVRTTTPK